MKRYSLALLLLISLPAQFLVGQNPRPTLTPLPPTEAQDDEVVRITTNLVQIDAVVTDGEGLQVTDLRLEDFEIFEDGRSQQLTHLSYITLQNNAPTSVATSGPALPATPAPPERLRPERVRRTIALVVDDLSLSFISTSQVRQALKRFVDEQLQTGDMAAIVRTSAGAGALQQFTNDKRQLYAAIERIRWNPVGARGFAPLSSSPLEQLINAPAGANDTSARVAATAARVADEQEAQRLEQSVAEEEIFSVGTLGAVGFIVRGMENLPGRKNVVLYSDGIPLLASLKRSSLRNSQNGQTSTVSSGPLSRTRIIDALNRLTDQANRASVVIHTIDARGLNVNTLTAEDSVAYSTPGKVQSELFDRNQEFFNTQNGLIYLARQTGGLAVFNSNDLGKGLGRILQTQSGYYLLAYRPDEATFQVKEGKPAFHRLVVKVKRPGLKVHARTGFYGQTDQNVRAQRESAKGRLEAALASPFGGGEISMRLTALFNKDPQGGSFLHAMLHIEGRDLTFRDEPEGWKVAEVQVLAYTFNALGETVDSVNRNHTIRARGEIYEDIINNGLLYTVNVPVAKPGAYQFRVALRDLATKHIGAASQFIEIPDLKKDRLTLSGLILRGQAPNTATAANQPADGPLAGTPDVQAAAAVRKLKPGYELRYQYAIFNPRLGPDRKPQLQTQVRIFRDGKLLYEGKPTPYELEGSANSNSFLGGGKITLNKQALPGDYMLQILVRDTLAPEKNRLATQWVDFEVVNPQ